MEENNMSKTLLDEYKHSDGDGFTINPADASIQLYRPQDVLPASSPPTPFCGSRLPPLDAFVFPTFPLTVAGLMDLCTRCWLPGQMLPLSQETGEETIFGFFHRQRLRSECEMLLPRSIAIMDWWEVRRAMETFEGNPNVFRCRSIYLVLGYCEEYIRKLFGHDCLFDSTERAPTAIEKSEAFIAKHSLPPATNE
jgi:hypothetical protein